jgi:hypothetical protein
MLRLYSLYISVRRAVTLPDAVKWRCFYLWAGKASVLRSFTLDEHQAKRVKE